MTGSRLSMTDLYKITRLLRGNPLYTDNVFYRAPFYVTEQVEMMPNGSDLVTLIWGLGGVGVHEVGDARVIVVASMDDWRGVANTTAADPYVVTVDHVLNLVGWCLAPGCGY